MVLGEAFYDWDEDRGAEIDSRRHVRSVGVDAPAASQEHKPNIVVMVMDNLGWGEIGVYGGGILRGARTPRLDWLNANKRPDSEHTG